MTSTTSDSFFLKTEKTGLRGITLEDANENYLSWLNDKEVTKGLDSGLFPTDLQSLRTFVENMSKSKENLMFAIIDRSNGKHIGNIKLGNIHWINRTAEIGILIGDKSSWGKGFGRDACSLVVDYAFTTLNLRKVWLAVYSDNVPAWELYKKLGFIQEGCLKDHIYSDGKLVDKILMAIYKK